MFNFLFSKNNNLLLTNDYLHTRRPGILKDLEPSLTCGGE